MSTLCIDNTDIQGLGFINSEAKPEEIKDAIQATGSNLNKMGTSIPTPYARLFLFNSAFRELNEEENNKPGEAYNRTDTNYHALVSECLDMLEFLFLYGNDRQMTIIPWGQSERDELKNERGFNNQEIETANKHNKLGIALEDGLSNTPAFNNFPTIYIFRYNNIVVGGTSPFALVYTSPNWASKNETPLRRSGEGFLFNEDIQPLHRRGRQFRLFMQLYAIENQSRIHPDLLYYIKNDLNRYDNEINAYIYSKSPEELHTEFTQKYAKLKTSDNIAIQSKDCFLYYNAEVINFAESDYLLVCTSDRYKNEIDSTGATTRVPTPLVINKQGIGHNKLFWQGEVWQPKDYPMVPLNPILTDRYVPGFANTRYPVLTVDDFLEDSIIEVSYNIQKSKFYTGTRGNSNFLLPLKKEFFKFYNIEDLLDAYKNIYSIDIINPEDTESREITVSLNLPLQGGIITLTKVYKKDAIIDCWDASDSFDLAIFPFYRLISTNNPNGVKNIYNIMLGYTSVEKQLNFYRLEDATIKSIPAEKKDRMNRGFRTQHIHLDDAFDLIEVVAKGHTGLVIPLMDYDETTHSFRHIDIQNAGTDYTFCVDFGTTNTQISYGPSNTFDIKQIYSLDITKNDMQVVLLNEPGMTKDNEIDYGIGFEQFSQFFTHLKTEFVPILIGEGTYKFPMRTAVCEMKNLSQVKAHLFGTLNVGFDYMNEFKGSVTNTYKTNLKWANSSRDTMAQPRVQKFFEELMWIMKNKAVLNGGRPNFKLVFTYPQSMRQKQIDMFTKWWDAARKNVGADIGDSSMTSNALTIKVIEGVAPYYSFLNKLGWADTYTNIDIGGGTTDIVYISKNTSSAISYSAVFAANDLWGDGTNPAAVKQNGFYEYYLKTNFYKEVPEEHRNHLTDFVNNQANSSADIISFLFGKDSIYRFSDAINSSQDLQKLLLVHFCSIIYYMALCFLRDSVPELPYHISFTGMGSKYIAMIGERKSISSIIQAVLRYRLKPEGINVSDIDVLFAEQPKLVTANGGVIKAAFDETEANTNDRINPEKSIVYGWSGEEYDNKKISIGEIDNHQKGVLEEMERFLNMFDDLDFSESVFNMTDINCQDIKSMFKRGNLIESSFRNVAQFQNQLVNEGQTRVEEPMFFWPLKDALFQLSRRIANSANA